MPTTTVKFKLRRDTEVNLMNVVLAEGEPAYSTDTEIFKVGNGIDTWQSLSISTVPIGTDGSIPFWVVTTVSSNKIKSVETSENLTFANDVLDPRPVIGGSGQPNILGGTLRVEGNIEANGDAVETGSVSAKYLTLNDLTTNVETYVWNDQNTLLWQPFLKTGDETSAIDVLAWRPKLEQTQEITLLDSRTASLSSVVLFLNNLVTKLSERGIIYRPPIQPTKNVREFDVLGSMYATISNYTGTRIGKEHILVLTVTSGLWGEIPNLVEVSQIQSIELAFQTDLYISPYNSEYISDCRFMLSQNDDTNCIFYAYASKLSENIASGYRVVGETKKLITDQIILKNFFGNTDGTINRFQGIHCNWYTGYSGTSITNCRITKFLINYVE